MDIIPNRRVGSFRAACAPASLFPGRSAAKDMAAYTSWADVTSSSEDEAQLPREPPVRTGVEAVHGGGVTKPPARAGVYTAEIAGDNRPKSALAQRASSGRRVTIGEAQVREISPRRDPSALPQGTSARAGGEPSARACPQVSALPITFTGIPPAMTLVNPLDVTGPACIPGA